MKAGIGKLIITPPVGGWLLGPVAPSSGVHDDLYAKALVLDDGGQVWAILCLDLVGLSLAFSDELRTLIRRQTGMETVLINCSHTHSAPFSMPWSIDGWERHCREECEWQDHLRRVLLELVRDATQKRIPASLSVGRAPVRVGINRRRATENGVVMAPNLKGPEVPWVDVLRVNDEQQGRAIGVLFSHAAHPVIVHGASTLISADYPGAAAARIRRELGEQVLPLFAQGCGGNINGHPLRGGHSMAEEAGNRLGEAVLRALAESAPLEAPTFRIVSETVWLPCQKLPTAEACAKAIDKVEREISERVGGEAGNWSLRDRLRCLQALQVMVEKDHCPQVRFEITAVMLGTEWCLLTMPHEAFCDYALWVEEISPFEHTMTCAYTNGCEAYIPTDRDLELGELGGYEAASFPSPGAALAYRNRLALLPGVERQIKEAVCRLWDGYSNGSFPPFGLGEPSYDEWPFVGGVSDADKEGPG